MPTYDQIAWFPLCLGLTGLGVVLTWIVGRRRGAAAALRGLAWSLLPVAAYLTGVIKVIWQAGTAVARWAVGLVFSPSVWVGIAVAGLAALLFVVSGVLRRRAPRRGRPTPRRAPESAPPPPPRAAPRRAHRRPRSPHTGVPNSTPRPPHVPPPTTTSPTSKKFCAGGGSPDDPRVRRGQ